MKISHIELKYHRSSQVTLLSEQQMPRPTWSLVRAFTNRSLKRSLLYVEDNVSKGRSITVITKTCLYNFSPLKPHFYIVKLGFTGYTLFFLISAQKHRGGSNEYPQSMF